MIRLIPLFAVILFAAVVCEGAEKKPLPGAYQFDKYRHLVEGRSVAIVANQTTMVGQIHLVDYLLGNGIDLKAIFAPEHGYREMASDGELIKDGIDPVTGIRLISLYGSRRKPSPEDMEGIDIVVFDIQDVGARFYTYISTLHYVMESCAENGVKCIVLDRPNPNGFYIDGNIPDTAFRSFVCMHPVPVVHGMTVGEYAKMINGEGWLSGGIKCDLEVVRCLNYTHQTLYELPVRPSPNLPNQTSVYLYPSICFFEGTYLSLGRGTPFPFQVYGSPLLPDRGFSFTPESVAGSVNPPLRGIKCYGTDLRDALKMNIVPRPEINLIWIIEAFNSYPEKDNFFNSYFDVLAGGPWLREQIQKGMSQEEIRESWTEGLGKFSKIRRNYLLYRE